MLKWQQAILKEIHSATNRELFDDFIELAGGDDWDGQFTDRGWWEFEQLQNELESRLEDWLKEKI